MDDYAYTADVAYGLPTGCIPPRAQYRPYIHIVTDMEYTCTYVSVFRNNVTAHGTYVHGTDCIFSAGQGRGMVKWAEQPLPGQLSLGQ